MQRRALVLMRIPFWRRWPPYLINGATVATGVALVQLLAQPLPTEGVLAAGAGAVVASLGDQPGTPARNVRRMAATALLGVLAYLLVNLWRGHPLLLGLMLLPLGWMSGMTLAWGARAGPLSFVGVLGFTFAMAWPHGSTWALWALAGAAVYMGWGMLVSRLLQRRWRTLAVAELLRALARLLQARAALLAAPQAAAQPQATLQAWIRDEARFEEMLQAARDQVLPAPHAAPQLAELLLRAIDLRDTLLALVPDVQRLGDVAATPRLRGAVAQQLLAAAEALQRGAQSLQTGAALPGPVLPPLPEPALYGEAADAAPDAAVDASAPRAIVPDRLRHLREDLLRMQAVLDGAPAQLPLTPEQLGVFVSTQSWPLAAWRAHLRWASPVLRHAMRLALALPGAYFLALLLPWAAHPHWLVLSVAVVLRGNLQQTLARRNERVAGTLVGCLLVLGLARVPALGEAAFVVAVGVAHAFAVRRYALTALASTVMALLQAQAAHPGALLAVGERVADTLLGALLAWSFSYVLPSWERRSVARLAQRLQTALAALSAQVLRWPGADNPAQGNVALRLARREVYEALGALAAAAQRSRAEPRMVQLPLQPLALLLTHGHGLLAQLAALRLMLARRAERLPLPAAQQALDDGREALLAQLGPATAAGGAPSVGEAPLRSPGEDLLLHRLRQRLQAAARTAAAVRQAATEVERASNAR